MNQGVHHIGAYGGGVGKRLHWTPALHRSEHQQQHQNLPDTEQHPHRALKGPLQIAAPTNGHQKRLHQPFKKGLVDEVKGVGEYVHRGCLRAQTIAYFGWVLSQSW